MKELTNVQLYMLWEAFSVQEDDGRWRHKDEEDSAEDLGKKFHEEIKRRGFEPREFKSKYNYLFDEDDEHGFDYH